MSNSVEMSNVKFLVFSRLLNYLPSLQESNEKGLCLTCLENDENGMEWNRMDVSIMLTAILDVTICSRSFQLPWSKVNSHDVK